MIFNYLIFSISIVFLSFIIGMIMTALVRTTDFYEKKISNLNFIKNEVTNKIIGIGVIKWIVKNTFFKILNQKLKIEREMNLFDLKNIRNEMTKSEIDHLFAFLFVAIFILFKIFEQKYLLSLVLLFVNIIMNLYPSLLLQQNKRRLDKLITKVEKLES